MAPRRLERSRPRVASPKVKRRRFRRCDMNVLVIGATGRTGRHAVTRLLEGGHDVTAFARTPWAVTTRDRLRVVQGDARDADSIDRAVQGQDAVLVAFGARSLNRDNVQEVLMRN